MIKELNRELSGITNGSGERSLNPSEFNADRDEYIVAYNNISDLKMN